jgi:hypothetical protein
MNFESNKEREIALDEENEMKCIPKRMNNQMPYQKIEIEIRENKQWPPITQVNEIQKIDMEKNKFLGDSKVSEFFNSGRIMI